MRPLFTVFLFISVSSFAQTIRAVGQVVDTKTLEPLPYVNIVLEEARKGISTDEKGRYTFVIKDISDKTEAKFSYVGYQSKYVKLKDLKGKIVKLSPSIDGLAEVYLYTIQNKKTKRINDFRIGESIGLGNFSGGQYPSIVARYYEKPAKFEEGCFIKQIEVRYFSVEETLYGNAKYRLRIMAVDQNGKPSYDLLSDGIIIEKAPNQFKTKIDMLPYKIPVPESGFFVAVEHLFIKENSYYEKKDYRVNDTIIYKNVELRKYGPVFKGVLEEYSPNFSSYYKDTSGWRKMNTLDNSNDAFSGKLPVPAFKIILTD
ncbi:carboxypeptidase-like regulatory domain-containing protein [Zunongwangia sp. HGR-M22]|uniref:carboxypeptidase-like regulatory domain-containing protein n=1 Tax=Zunongwangia sp. HGR-M22 TaxID=3015168 RepID=UPI0022DD2B94|nr:carboxypeptidase-like regulatory domain-containing protein [Zunongwangia sp. HGR-M22]WBL26672.1 carboxypeptidase-like regulatory domain-containing protein [Zunongwangia sp. HGR-M22]